MRATKYSKIGIVVAGEEKVHSALVTVGSLEPPDAEIRVILAGSVLSDQPLHCL